MMLNIVIRDEVMRPIFVLFFIVASMPALSWFEKDETYVPLVETIELSELKMANSHIRESLMKVIVLNEWEIESHSPTQILARSKARCLLRADLDAQRIVLQEVLTSCTFDASWLASIRKRLIQDSVYHRHLEIARDDSSDY
ncbi:MAG TPA: hypothetical protein ENJ13_10840 [Chromatiales bacterium]|nr:hypothetical protein [Chromatiales bacterium]